MSSPQISDKKEEAGGILKKSSKEEKEEKEEKDKKQVGFAPGSAPVIEVDGGHSPVVKKNFMVDMKRLSKSHYQIRVCFCFSWFHPTKRQSEREILFFIIGGEECGVRNKKRRSYLSIRKDLDISKELKFSF